MSEGRTPTATFTQQRELEQEDVDILHQIVIRAQNDSLAETRPRDALLQAYDDIYKERNLTQRQDRVCVDILFKLLDPAQPGESLYHRFENVLQDRGIVLAYDDDDDVMTDGPNDWASRHDVLSEITRSPARFLRSPRKALPRPVTANVETEGESLKEKDDQFGGKLEDEEFSENPPAWFPQVWRRAEERDRIVLTRQTIEVWRDAAEAVRERNDEARADALYALRLKRKVLKQSIAVFQDLNDAQNRADQIYHHKLAANVLGKACDEYKVRRIASIDEDRIKGVSLYRWTIAHREARFVRAKDHGLKQAATRRLISTFRQRKARQVELDNILYQKQNQENRELLGSAVSFLSHKSQSISKKAVIAEGINRNALYHSSIKIWQGEATKVQNLQITADDAREYFLMKHVVGRLRAVSQARIQRRENLARWAFSRWRSFTKSRKHAHYDELYRQFRKNIKLRLAEKCLIQWRNRTQALQQYDTEADEVYQSSIKKRIIQPAIESSFTTADWTRRSAPVAVQVADQFLQRRAMTALHMQHQTLFDNEDRAIRLRQYRVEQKAVQGMRQMQLRAFELQRRIADADAFRNRHEKRLVRNMLARLRTRLALSRTNGEEELTLTPAPAITPARKRQQLFDDSTRLSTTPAYTPFVTPFMAKLTNETRVLEDIEDMDESKFDSSLQDLDDLETEPGG